MHNRHPAVRC